MFALIVDWFRICWVVWLALLFLLVSACGLLPLRLGGTLLPSCLWLIAVVLIVL